MRWLRELLDTGGSPPTAFFINSTIWQSQSKIAFFLLTVLALKFVEINTYYGARVCRIRVTPMSI